jgi:hypothetical protein
MIITLRIQPYIFDGRVVVERVAFPAVSGSRAKGYGERQQGGGTHVAPIVDRIAIGFFEIAAKTSGIGKITNDRAMDRE